MRRHAKASSAGSTSGTGSSRVRFGRAFATRGGSGDADGSSAPSHRGHRLLLLACVALASVLVLGLSAAPAFGAKALFDFFGHTGAAAGQFTAGTETLSSENFEKEKFEPGPGALAVNDATGDVYVVDRFNNRIEQFDSDYNFIRAWGVDTIPGGAAGTGTLTSGSAEVTSVVTTSKAFIPGQEVSGTGIPAGTTIRSVTTGAGAASKMVLSEKATASGSGVTITAAASPSNTPQNEKQTVRLAAGGGNFKLKFTTTMPTAEGTTANIPFNATAATVQSSLEALANVGAGNVEVTGPVGGPYEVEFKGKFADTNVAQMTTAAGSPALSGPPGPTIIAETAQEGAGVFEKCTTATTCQAGAPSGVGGGLNSPRGIAVYPGNQNLYVTEAGGLRVSQYDPSGNFVRTWGGDVVASGPDNKPEVQSIKITAATGTFVLTFGSGTNSSTTGTGSGTYGSGSNEITSVTTSAGVFTVGKEISGAGIPAGTKITAVEPGKLTISNNTTEAKTATALTANLPFNASATTVEVALNALNTVSGALGSVSVSGGPGDATGSNPYRVAFGGALANTDVSPIVLNASGLGLGPGAVIPCEAGPAGKTLSYEWLRNGVPIGGATSANYTVAAADAGTSIQCRVKAASSEGATLKANTSPIVVAPAPATAPPTPGTPTISGSLATGSTLTCAAGSWTGSPSFAYQWLRNGAPIGGATATTYVLQVADSETAIQCEVTGTNAGGAAVGESALKVPHAEPPVNNGEVGTAPSISGTLAVGEVLTCANGTWTGATSFAYQWLRNGNPIGGATTNSYTLVASDAGTAIQCQVTAANASGSGTAFSANSVIPPVPSPAPPSRPTTAIGVSGTYNVGGTLTCTPDIGFGLGWSPNPPVPNLAVQWLRNGVPISGATAATYSPVGADLDKLLQCQVTASNVGGTSVVASPAALAAVVVANPPAATATVPPPSIVTTTTEGASAEICEAGVDICKAGLSPPNTEGGIKRVGGTFITPLTNGTDSRVAVAPGGPYAGDIFVSDGGGNRMQIFEPAGAFVATFGKEVLQSGPETVGKNVCIVALGDVCKAGKNTPLNNGANTYGFGNNTGLSQNKPESFAIDSSGAIYVPGAGRQYVQSYSPDLSSEQDFATATCSFSGNTGFVAGCDEVTIDRGTGDVLVRVGVVGAAEECGSLGCQPKTFLKEQVIDRLNPAGEVLETSLEGVGIKHINSIAIDNSTGQERSGRVYFTTSTPEQRVDVLGEPASPSIVLDPIGSEDVKTHEVTVHGTVNPDGDKIHTFYRFETLRQGGVWTPTTEVDIGNGTSPVPVEATIPGLRANTKYEVRLVAVKGGPNYSPKRSFITLPQGPDVETGEAHWSGPPSSNPSLTFSGTVDDNNLPVHYYFEYGSDASYGKRVPIFETGSYPAAQEAFLARQTVPGLDPSGTYHYRVVARTESGTTVGADREIGPAVSGGRFAEMVSPVEKGVGKVGEILVFTKQNDFQAALDGEDFAYPFQYGDPEATAGGEVIELGSRGAGGWSSEQLPPASTTPPIGSAFLESNAGSAGEVKWMSPELNCSFIESKGKVNAEVPLKDTEENIQHLFLRNAAGEFKMITPSPLGSVPSEERIKVRGATPDCQRVIFQTRYQLLAGMPTESKDHIYEWEAAGGPNGTLRLVDILPNGTISTGGSIRKEGPSLQGGEVEPNAVSQTNADRAFFFATSNEGGDTGKKAIFVRKNHAVTVDVSQSQTALANTGTTTYQMASADGSHVFFTAIAGIASNSATTTGNSLYDYNVNSGVLRDLTPNANPANTAGAAVEGVLGASTDGSYIYLGAKGQLVSGQGKTYAENNSGKTDNIYLAHGGSLSFVGTMSDEENSGSEAYGHADFITNVLGINAPAFWEARVTPDGKYLLFGSRLNQTAYNGEGMHHFYRYSAATGSIACVSCIPGGLGNEGMALVYKPRTNQGADVYHGRAISEDGQRAIFTAQHTVVSGGNRREVSVPYEWNEGTLTKLAENGKAVDASGDFSSIFILTSQPLVPQDKDLAPDVYSLRTNGGFAYSPPEPCDPLTEGSCQGTPPTPPTPGADPESSSHNGPGNPTVSKPKKCKKGQVLKHGKCVKKPQKHKGKKGKKKAGKRAAKSSRGGSK
ncbi:MAG TPA: hypothetical protein VHU86_07860 [Solirubrobacterales bacterium]|nr:hypothetical protein [Solirubrobacterales bacterium]